MSVIDFLTNVDQGNTGRTQQVKIPSPSGGSGNRTGFDLEGGGTSPSAPVTTVSGDDAMILQFQRDAMRFGLTGNEQDYLIPGWVETYTQRPFDSTMPKDPLNLVNTKDMFGNPMPLGEANENGVRVPQMYSYGELTRAFYDMGSNERAQIEELLWAAGLLDDMPEVPGSPLNEKSFAAWGKALEASAFSQISVMNLLQQQAQKRAEAGLLGGGGGGGGGGAGPRRPTVQVMSDDDAQSVIDNMAANILGRTLSEDEAPIAREIIKALQGRQQAEQSRVIDQQMAGGGTVEAPTNPQTIVGDEIEQRFETESSAYGVAEAFVQMARMIGG